MIEPVVLTDAVPPAPPAEVTPLLTLVVLTDVAPPVPLPPSMVQLVAAAAAQRSAAPRESVAVLGFNLFMTLLLDRR